MNTKITGTGYSLPVFRADNDYLATLVETSDEWITERTGIRARHLAGEETTVSMAADAAGKALKRAGVDPSEVELLIAAPQPCWMPSASCLSGKKFRRN